MIRVLHDSKLISMFGLARWKRLTRQRAVMEIYHPISCDIIFFHLKDIIPDCMLSMDSVSFELGSKKKLKPSSRIVGTTPVMPRSDRPSVQTVRPSRKMTATVKTRPSVVKWWRSTVFQDRPSKVVVNYSTVSMDRRPSVVDDIRTVQRDGLESLEIFILCVLSYTYNGRNWWKVMHACEKLAT